jgi:hypothetical protein
MNLDSRKCSVQTISSNILDHGPLAVVSEGIWLLLVFLLIVLFVALSIGSL